jgi:hypothetical protein
MGLPRQLPSSDSGSGHGPFGEKAFRRALIGCVVLPILGLAMVLLGSGAPRSVGISLIVLGAVGLVTSAAGLLTERFVGRRPPPPQDIRAGNGHGPFRPDAKRIKRQRR